MEHHKAFQDYYPPEVAHCFGCGYLNEFGHQIKSHWDGDVSICRFTPRPEHIAIPGYVYGGLIASILDCHGTGTAAAAMYREQGRSMDSKPPLRFVTASLHVDFLKPTPMGVELEARAVVEEVKGRKVIVNEELYAGELLCARGRVVAVVAPDHLYNGCNSSSPNCCA
jgi:acyl-coenzyme A thioesterase PaaI-like protein